MTLVVKVALNPNTINQLITFLLKKKDIRTLAKYKKFHIID